VDIPGKAYFDILNRVGVTHDCDRQTDRRTDSVFVAKATLQHAARPKDYITNLLALRTWAQSESLHKYGNVIISAIIPVSKSDSSPAAAHRTKLLSEQTVERVTFMVAGVR